MGHADADRERSVCGAVLYAQSRAHHRTRGAWRTWRAPPASARHFQAADRVSAYWQSRFDSCTHLAPEARLRSTLFPSSPTCRREMSHPRKRSPWYTSLYFQVLVGIAGRGVLGLISPAAGAAVRPLGDGFIKLIK